jgi:CubicO group peptidase (beta-lactamase class C family)
MPNFARAFLLVAVLATSLSGQARTLTVGSPADARMSAAVLDSGVALYRDAVDRGELVGAVLLVARHGTIVLHEAIGSRHRDSGLPMERSTMFRMASNTKPVVATAAAILVERGKLRYDDPVSKYIPSFGTGASSAITVHELLTHTSGLRINTLFLTPMLENPTLQLEAARFASIGPKAPVGAEYSYSNPGYNTLGAIIEIASGKLLDQFLDEEIYDKLGMRDTYHHETAEVLGAKLARMGAVYYRRDSTTKRWVAGWKPGDRPQVPFVRASGGLISTALDYAVFLQTFLNGGSYGGVHIISPQSVRRMTTSHTPAGGPAYGYGWSVDAAGVYSHGGSDGTFGWVDPARGIIGLVLTQTPRGANPRRAFMQLVNRAVLETPAVQSGRR